MTVLNKPRYKLLVLDIETETLKVSFFEDGKIKDAVLKATEFVKNHKLVIVVYDLKFKKNILSVRKGVKI